MSWERSCDREAEKKFHIRKGGCSGVTGNVLSHSALYGKDTVKMPRTYIKERVSSLVNDKTRSIYVED